MSHLGARSAANLPINRGFDYHFGFLKGGEDHYSQGSGSKNHEPGIGGTVDLWSGHSLSNETGIYSGYLYADKVWARAAHQPTNHRHPPPVYPLTIFARFGRPSV